MTQRKLERLLASATPFVDVRAPGEFARGAVPQAVNLPLLDDCERRRVGIAYKHQGGRAAVALGETLVSGAVREHRIDAWATMAATHAGLWLYCWRGGLRSEIAQRWLRERGFDAPRVPGGFKALRHCCQEILERAPTEKNWLVLGGRTGSGKTAVVRQHPDSIDLEGLANHRGSAFGALPPGQPPPVGFEIALAVAFLQLPGGRVLLEDESRTIGRLALPASWHRRMQEAPLIVLEVDVADRVVNIRRDYVDEPLAAGIPRQDLHGRYRAALDRIRKRLGGARHSEVSASLARGFETGDHERWIEQLLDWYYDPMYDHQLETKQRRIIARGNGAEICEFLGLPDFSKGT